MFVKWDIIFTHPTKNKLSSKKTANFFAHIFNFVKFAR